MQTSSRTFVIMEPDPDIACQLCGILKGQGFTCIQKKNLAQVTAHLEITRPLAVILDMDIKEVNNKNIRQMTLDYPETVFLGLSSRRFHPDMKNAICYHMYACLRKPLDPDELTYFIRSIYADAGKTDESGDETHL